MTDSDDNRYESLKLLCRDQVLANEVLKDEIERLRKCFYEISKHRTFLLDKLLSQQKEQAALENEFSKKNEKSSSSKLPGRRPTNQQKPKANSFYQHSSRGKGVAPEVLPQEESDPENESWHGDYDNGGWDDSLQMSNYPRSLKRQPKSMPTSRAAHPTNSGGSAFKKPRTTHGLLVNSRDRCGVNDYSHRPNGSPCLFDDFSEEPPVIYSSTKNGVQSPMVDTPLGETRSRPSYASGNRPSDGVSKLSVQRLSGHSQVPTILKSPNAMHVPVGSSTARIYIQKPSTVGFNGPKLH